MQAKTAVPTAQVYVSGVCMCVGGWVDEWMGGWVDGWGGWMGGWVGG